MGTHDPLWTLDLGTGRVAWSLGNPGYSQLQNTQWPQLTFSQVGLKVCTVVKWSVSTRNHLDALGEVFLISQRRH